MNKYENAMKLMEERCRNGKEEVIALAAISLSPSAAGNLRPAAGIRSTFPLSATIDRAAKF